MASEFFLEDYVRSYVMCMDLNMLRSEMRRKDTLRRGTPRFSLSFGGRDIA